MFGQLKLDDETFDEIFEYHKRKIPQIDRKWTDFNEHDPGITFLELLSWMKELQQFHLDQIGAENYKMFLKLIGMKQRRKKAVQTFAILYEIEKEFFLPKNSRIYAGDIVFETAEERCFSPNRLLSLSSELKKKEGKVILRFAHPFPEETYHRLYFKLSEPKEGKRQPIKEDFFPLIQWRLEAIKDGKKIPCRILKDETYGLLYSGEVQFVLEEEKGQKIQTELQNEKEMLLCFVIESGEYDILPSIQTVEWNSIMVQQTETRSTYEEVSVSEDRKTVLLNSRMARQGKLEFYREKAGVWYPIEIEKKSILPDKVKVQLKEEVKESEILYAVTYEADFEAERNYEMDGFPFQQIRLEHTELLQDQIEIIVTCPFQENGFERYQRVENFYHSGPEDRHFVFDEEQGCLYFGDCERGLAPKGELKIIRFISSRGLKGNIKEQQLKFFEDGTIPAKVTNYENTSSGADKETIEECFWRFMRESTQTQRAVTMEDYEALVRQTPGLFIHKVKATTSFLTKSWENQTADNTVYIVVKPYSEEVMPKLSSGYERNIRAMLEKKRMLGTRIQILSPEYVGIYLFAEIICKAHYRNAKEQIEKAVRTYFSEELLEFGKPLVYGRMYGLIESLACVEHMINLSIHAQGKGVLRNPNGDYEMPVNALIYLESMDFSITLSK